LAGGARLSLGFFRSPTEPAVEPEDFDRPVLVLNPSEDRMTDIALTRRFVARRGAEVGSSASPASRTAASPLDSPRADV
jgi:hypothetical protein